MKRKILVVDDDLNFLNVIKEMLEDNGDQVTLCSKAEESLSAIREYQPNCLVLDVRMPGLEGDLLLPWIQRQSPDLAVLICTGVEIDEAYFYVRGANGIIYKPFNFEKMTEMIDHAIEAKKAERVRKSRDCVRIEEKGQELHVILNNYSIGQVRKSVLRAMITKALEKTQYNIDQAADMLAIRKDLLVRLMRRLQLSSEDQAAA